MQRVQYEAGRSRIAQTSSHSCLAHKYQVMNAPEECSSTTESHRLARWPCFLLDALSDGPQCYCVAPFISSGTSRFSCFSQGSVILSFFPSSAIRIYFGSFFFFLSWALRYGGPAINPTGWFKGRATFASFCWFFPRLERSLCIVFFSLRPVSQGPGFPVGARFSLRPMSVQDIRAASSFPFV